MAICNACRYCEGYCAVFPAMERSSIQAMEGQTVFSPGDLAYLANLCHNCAECYYACPYAPPHEFAVNVPKIFAEIRLQSYRHYAWPKPVARVFWRNGLFVSLLVAAGLVAAFFKAKWVAGDF